MTFHLCVMKLMSKYMLMTQSSTHMGRDPEQVAVELSVVIDEIGKWLKDSCLTLNEGENSNSVQGKTKL